jgi:hypothetical protein
MCPERIQVIHFEKDLRIVDPILDIGILQIEGHGPHPEYRKSGTKYMFLKTQVIVEITGYLEIPGPKEGPYRFCIKLHGDGDEEDEAPENSRAERDYISSLT